jgi:pimeloyl-ACP methyl ester carboxylesterase
VWALFEESSHMPHVEEPEAFLERVEEFLRSID